MAGWTPFSRQFRAARLALPGLAHWMVVDVQPAPDGNSVGLPVRAAERPVGADHATCASRDDQHVGRRAAGRHAGLRTPDRQ